MFKTILFPIDMSPEAQQAAHLAIDLVKQNYEDLFTPFYIEKGKNYMKPYLNSLKVPLSS